MLIYNAEKDDASFEGWAYRVYNLKWITAPPTVEGWYWVIPKPGTKTWNDHKDGIQIIYRRQGKSGLFVVVEHDSYFIDDDFAHWLGPLPVPELPEKL